jgi:hypothetical protein
MSSLLVKPISHLLLSVVTVARSRQVSGQLSDEFLKKQIPFRRNVYENVQWPSFSAPYEQIWQYSATSSLHFFLCGPFWVIWPK